MPRFGSFASEGSLSAAGCRAPSGCGGCGGEATMTSRPSSRPITAENALTANALTANALTANALTANALTANALTANALTANALTANGAARSAGARVPQVRRVVRARRGRRGRRCAIDGKRYEFPGSLGLAPRVGPRARLLRRRVPALGVGLRAGARRPRRRQAHDLDPRRHTARCARRTASCARYTDREATYYGNVFIRNAADVHVPVAGQDQQRARVRRFDRPTAR